MTAVLEKPKPGGLAFLLPVLLWIVTLAIGGVVAWQVGSQASDIYDDFARSRMSDIRAFVLQDFWGAGFFHLVAELVIAGIFGMTAALLTDRARRRVAA